MGQTQCRVMTLVHLIVALTGTQINRWSVSKCKTSYSVRTDKIARIFILVFWDLFREDYCSRKIPMNVFSMLDSKLKTV